MSTAPPPGFFDENDDEVLTTPPGLLLPRFSSLTMSEPSRPEPPAHPPGFDPILSREMATPIQREELKKFLQWKDASSKTSEIAEQLLRMYKIEDVAIAIRDKFGMLPQGWREQGLAKPGRARSETSVTITSSDRKINEILDSEARFVNTILEVQTKFLDRLYEIFGSGNKDAIKNLGLSQEETNQIFEQLPAIVRFSQTLLSKLELVNMVRQPPATGEGRALHVGRAFLEMAPKLHVYAPAITSYQQSLDILTQATNRLRDRGDSKKKSLDFLTLWEKVTVTNEILKGQQLNAVLITPMQRIPRYKMLLEALVKDCDHPESVPVVQEALELFSSASRNMNEALKSHEKLKGFFGATTELKPMSSSGGTTTDGEIKIVNTYTNKVLGQ